MRKGVLLLYKYLFIISSVAFLVMLTGCDKNKEAVKDGLLEYLAERRGYSLAMTEGDYKIGTVWRLEKPKKLKHFYDSSSNGNRLHIQPYSLKDRKLKVTAIRGPQPYQIQDTLAKYIEAGLSADIRKWVDLNVSGGMSAFAGLLKQAEIRFDVTDFAVEEYADAAKYKSDFQKSDIPSDAVGLVIITQVSVVSNFNFNKERLRAIGGDALVKIFSGIKAEFIAKSEKWSSISTSLPDGTAYAFRSIVLTHREL